MAVIFILSLLVIMIILLISFYEKSSNANCKSRKRLDGRVVIVTGGTSGMGLEVATDLARRGAKVIIACPFEDEGLHAQKLIIEKADNKSVIFKLLDLGSLTSIRQFAADIVKTEDRLDILINNAGVGVPLNPKSVNGTNFIMHVNYFGHFLLTLLLLPLLKKTGKSSEPSRIVNLSSVMHLFGKVDHESRESLALLYRLRCYSNSKYCMVLFAHGLSKKLKGSHVVVNAVDPGAVGTGIYESLNKVVGVIIKYLLRSIFKTPLEGAQTTLYAALEDEAGDVTGQFFKNCKLYKAKESAYNDTLSDKLWEDSVKIVKLDVEEVNKCLL